MRIVGNKLELSRKELKELTGFSESQLIDVMRKNRPHFKPELGASGTGSVTRYTLRDAALLIVWRILQEEKVLSVERINALQDRLF